VPELRTTIAACLIVRDSEDVLERALASIRPHVDEVNVYDTGSTDGTLAPGQDARCPHPRRGGRVARRFLLGARRLRRSLRRLRYWPAGSETLALLWQNCSVKRGLERPCETLVA
jgi:hypothetical protein